MRLYRGSRQWSIGLLCALLQASCATRSREPSRVVTPSSSTEQSIAPGVQGEAQLPQQRNEFEMDAADRNHAAAPAARADSGADESTLGKAAPSDAPEPQPTIVESAEIRAYVQEFDAEWEKLSSSRTCEDACRAYSSMTRSAARICDLVASGDPRARCRNARSRLDQASRDLANRCAACR
jgi:hypothetical protein